MSMQLTNLLVIRCDVIQISSISNRSHPIKGQSPVSTITNYTFLRSSVFVYIFLIFLRSSLLLIVDSTVPGLRLLRWKFFINVSPNFPLNILLL